MNLLKGFAFLGFGAAMFVVYFVAGEVMLVLQCIGYVSGISDAMLGITFLAWGNSIGGEFKLFKIFITLGRRTFSNKSKKQTFKAI